MSLRPRLTRAGGDQAVRRLPRAVCPAPLPVTAAREAELTPTLQMSKLRLGDVSLQVWPTPVATALARILSPPLPRWFALQACFRKGGSHSPSPWQLGLGGRARRRSGLETEVAASRSHGLLGRGFSRRSSARAEATAFGWWDEGQGGSTRHQGGLHGGRSPGLGTKGWVDAGEVSGEVPQAPS